MPRPARLAVLVACAAALAVLEAKRRQRAARKNAARRMRKIRDLVEIDQGAPVRPQFEPVLLSFLANFAHEREEGAQLCCYYQNEAVVDVAGFLKKGAGPHAGPGRDDLAIVFSCTKVVESLCVAILASRGFLAYDDPVAKFWPEFGLAFRDGDKITVRQLMQHQAGLSGFRESVPIEQALRLFGPESEAQLSERHEFLLGGGIVQEWDPSERRQGYHAVTRGFFTAGLVRKVDPFSRSLPEFVAQEIVGRVDRPVEFYVGCPPEAQARVMRFHASESLFRTVLRLVAHRLGLETVFYDEFDRLKPFEVASLLGILFVPSIRRSLLFVEGLSSAHEIANNPMYRSLEAPSVTGITNARSLAAIMNELCVGGGGLISSQGLQEAMESSTGPVFDELLQDDLTFSNCGWGLDRFQDPAAGVTDWCGWAGAGGSMCVFNTRLRAALVYVPNKLDSRLWKSRAWPILVSFVQCIAAGQ